MTFDLSHWQLRLADHFSELYSYRRQKPGRAVFAFEHGLDQADRDALSAAVREYVSEHPPSFDHWLPWIVYATEIGYLYSGDEYWQTFEEETPGWREHGDRHCVRKFYNSFHDEFGGAKPSGVWAQHFSIICWPITHAILPRDLQRQLARVLYELRHLYSADLFESPKVLGEFIAARSWHATSRFRNFAQEEELVGQIAAALLLSDDSSSEGLILPDTLSRISEDLDRERRSREWLRKARNMARDRATVRGLGFGRGGTSRSSRRHESATAGVAELGIEPRLLLCPVNTDRTEWKVLLEIPDLTNLGLRFPQARDTLAGARLVVSGASGRPRARGSCLYGPQRVALARWPDPGEVLLRFENADPQLEYLLRTECLLRPGPKWLFRIATDGLAYESRSLRVRAGERYILVSNSAIDQVEGVYPIALKCESTYAIGFALPEAIDTAWEETLTKLDLAQAKKIEVWPAGLAAVAWDGEGHGEWLAAEQPTLAVCTDHAVGTLVVSMAEQAEESLELRSIKPGEPVFVQLPHLALGLHRVRFAARSGENLEEESIGELDVVIRIRDSRPWSPDISPHGPLQVVIDPPAPTLEELWEGRAEFSLRGPAGRRVRIRVSLFERAETLPTYSEQLPPLRLPIASGEWRAHFQRHFSEKDKVRNFYDAARRCEIEFRAEELGVFVAHAEREFTPLRWALRRGSNGDMIRLLNDSGQTEQPSITCSAFETPLEFISLDAQEEYEVPSSGGMYRATLGDFSVALICPPTVERLEDLRCEPNIQSQPRSPGSICRAIASAHVWGEAKLPGDLFSAKRKQDVLEAITSHVFNLIGGNNWARVESIWRNRRGALTVLQDAISRRRDEAALGVILARDYRKLARAECSERVDRLASLGTRFLGISLSSGVDDSDEGDGASALLQSENWLAELALRLASDIQGVEEWAGEDCEKGVRFLVEDCPTLARAARYLVLATLSDAEMERSLSGGWANWRWT